MQGKLWTNPLSHQPTDICNRMSHKLSKFVSQSISPSSHISPPPSCPVVIISINGLGQDCGNHSSCPPCPMSSQLPNSATNHSDPSPLPHFFCHCLISGSHNAWPEFVYYSCLTDFLASFHFALFQYICHPTCYEIAL